MSMLTYVDNTAADRPLVIGAGVPASWLDHRIDSGYLDTEYGPVRWVWNAGTVTVDIADASVSIRLGPSFGGAGLVRNRVVARQGRAPGANANAAQMAGPIRTSAGRDDRIFLR
jgi:hypothetical protein